MTSVGAVFTGVSVLSTHLDLNNKHYVILISVFVC